MKAEDIAASLSEAQRRWLTDRAEFRKPRPWAEARWMTLPPASTYRVLKQRGLIDGSGQILGDGLVVRSHLMKERGEI